MPNVVEIIDAYAQTCPATYSELLAKYTEKCKECDELRKQRDLALQSHAEICAKAEKEIEELKHRLQMEECK